MKLEIYPQGDKKRQAARLLLEHYNGDTSDETWAPIIRGANVKQGFLVITEGEEVLAACLIETAEAEGLKVILLRTMKGKEDSIGWRVWKEQMEELKKYAKAQGFQKIYIQGRPAWQRLGWKTEFVAVSYDLDSEG